jgi:hypothetical protein
MCAELKLRKHQINKLENMNNYDFELIVDNQDNFTLSDVEYNHQPEDSVEHVFIVSISLCGFFLIMFNIINYLKLIN